MTPNSQPAIALKILAAEEPMRAIELGEACKKQKIPSQNIWSILRRLSRRGCVKVSKRIDAGNSLGPVPLYRVTDRGRKILRAMELLRS